MTTEILVRVIDCHVVFRTSAPQYLMLKRADHKQYPGIWQCVTGRVKVDEKPYQTALRELAEETALKPVSMWTVDQINLFYEAMEDRVNLIPIFGVEVANDQVRLSDEHVDHRWCSVEEAVDLLLWDQQKMGLTAFHKMLTEKSPKLTFSRIPL